MEGPTAPGSVLARNWCGRTSGNLPAGWSCGALASRTIRPRQGGRPLPSRSADRAGCYRPHHHPPWTGRTKSPRRLQLAGTHCHATKAGVSYPTARRPSALPPCVLWGATAGTRFPPLVQRAGSPSKFANRGGRGPSRCPRVCQNPRALLKTEAYSVKTEANSI